MNLIRVIDELLDAAENVIVDGLSMVCSAIATSAAGEMPLKEWAEAGAQSTDKIKNRAQKQGLQYVGGYLRFRRSSSDPDMIQMSFEMYFLDRAGQWQMAAHSTDILCENFDLPSLQDIDEYGEVQYELN